jgi:hypothetical protein
MRKPQPKKPLGNRLFIATRTHEVIFVSDSKGKGDIKDEAEEYLEEQDKYFDPPIVVKEITSKGEIPEEWKESHAFIWGDADEVTAEQFLDSQRSAQAKEEYEEYLRLKAKFG